MSEQIFSIDAIRDAARAAYRARLSTDACPYPDGSLAAAHWHYSFTHLAAFEAAMNGDPWVAPPPPECGALSGCGVSAPNIREIITHRSSAC
jgi:hypothetical protein